MLMQRLFSKAQGLGVPHLNDKAKNAGIVQHITTIVDQKHDLL